MHFWTKLVCFLWNFNWFYVAKSRQKIWKYCFTTNLFWPNMVTTKCRMFHFISIAIDLSLTFPWRSLSNFSIFSTIVCFRNVIYVKSGKNWVLLPKYGKMVINSVIFITEQKSCPHPVNDRHNRLAYMLTLT